MAPVARELHYPRGSLAAGLVVKKPHERPMARTGHASLSSEGIAWRTNGSEVELLVDLVNQESEATEPATLVIEAAPLGAFVPWSPLMTLPVGAIAPGAHLRIARSVARTTLRDLDPRRIAMGGGFGPTFPPDGLDLLTTTEWVGNLNVWFETAPERAVEVHRALNLNVAARRFAAVGVYAPTCSSGVHVEVECMGAGWTAELTHAPWQGVAVVTVGTPVAGRRAVVNLWVTRLSDEQCVLVELSFRSVEGSSEQLGCLRV
jgi:hypothetical protein